MFKFFKWLSINIFRKMEPDMADNVRSESLFVKDNEMKGKIFLSIHNLKDLKKDEILKFEKVTIGGSVFSASVKVQIDDRKQAETFSKTLVSVHLKKESYHFVVVDYSLSVNCEIWSKL